MSFIQRILKFTIVLGEGDFGIKGQNQIDLPALRARTDMVYAGGNALGTLNAEIFGMTLSQMNQICTLGFVYTQKRRNSITIAAGDENSSSGLATVFKGIITNAWPDMQGAPDVPFRIEGHAGLVDALAPADVTSISGTADVANLLSGLAGKMQLDFKNNGVSVKIPNPYYPGSARSQAQAIVHDAGIEWNAGVNGILEIWPAGQSVDGDVIVVSKETGMVGYPTYTSNGVMLRTLFNPSMKLGAEITIQSDLKLPYAGNWTVYSLNYHLDCLVPHGRWFADLQAAPKGSGPFTPSK